MTIHSADGAVDDLRRLGVTTENGDFLFGIRAFGVNLTILLPDSGYLDDLLRLLPPTWMAAAPLMEIDFRCEGIVAGSDSGDSDRVASLLKLASSMEYAIAERSPDHVFVHAGVVMIDGRVLILPGESHAGKSTLVAALVQKGATYFSDEYAVITADGLVLPYLRQIALRNSLFFPEGRTDLTAHAPDADQLSGGAVPSTVLVSTYQAGAKWSSTPLDRTSALIELCKNTVGFRNRPDMSFAHLNRLLEYANGYTCVRGEATDTIPHIMALLEPQNKPL
ncbi:MAG: hypothetical protein KC435_01665 [Thermomicrobiales bacterium]|nr:hypothetical protein [Thermomicrobiales bacterium]